MPFSPNRRQWESWEICFLKLTYVDFPYKEIAEYLNRSIGSIKSMIMANFKDSNKVKIGDKYNKLTVIELSNKPSGKAKRKMWKCLCDCGETTIVSTLNLRNNGVKGCNKCFDKTIGKIEFRQFSTLRAQSKQRGKEFTVSHEYIANLFDKQNGKCALTDIDLTTDLKTKRWNGTASLDRIDSSKGYIEGNLQWTHKLVNIMKWELNNEEFIDMCKKVVNKNIIQEEYDDKTNDWW